ncbi:tRNA (adenosine(37)-N6)-dimethylallyltransferase MiaA [Candidatus Peregrinibacteria bacterium]|nr:tRNA (adenosine(37)-N6)-dimethylallyltransferase MiaA [Candidatus Peregrinibacteria bacterium]
MGTDEKITASVSEFLCSVKQPLLVVLGPTASGKTDFSIDLAESIAATSERHGWSGVEIINADSRQFYRGLDIGTAKIKPEEMRGIPHHMIDMLDPGEEVTIAWYQEQVKKLIPAIHERKCVPMLVGGSMLYISAVIDGLNPLPAADPEKRKKLENEYDMDSGATLYKKLRRLDPDGASGIDQRNKPYVIRALEILEASAGTLSQQKKTTDVPWDLFIVGLRWPREKLVKRINERTRKLLSQNTHIPVYQYTGVSGWVGEVQGLLQGGIKADAPAMKSHGYQEIAAAISAKDSNIEKIAQDPKLFDAIAIKTRKYAKRQMTWWKHDLRIHWIDCN